VLLTGIAWLIRRRQTLGEAGGGAGGSEGPPRTLNAAERAELEGRE
jgi:hypothetical protein